MRNNADFEARQARSEGSMGVAKTCTVCGQTGHNRRTCPMVTGSQVRCMSHCSVVYYTAPKQWSWMPRSSLADHHAQAWLQ